MSREVIEQHGAADVHSVCSLAHYDAVFRQKLRNVVKRSVVVHRQSRLQRKSLGNNNNSSLNNINVSVPAYSKLAFVYYSKLC